MYSIKIVIGSKLIMDNIRNELDGLLEKIKRTVDNNGHLDNVSKILYKINNTKTTNSEDSDYKEDIRLEAINYTNNNTDKIKI